MRLASVIAIIGILGSVAPGMIANAATAKKSTKAPVNIPFESERPSAVRINDDATIIPAHRIRDLPVVDGKMGEHVRLDGGVELYLPFGRIVSAAMEFRPVRQSPTNPSLYEADPAYRQVANFDRALGPVCASDTALAGPMEMRINGEAMSVVKTMVMPVGDSGPSYRVVTVAETRWLDNDPQVQRLLTNCLTRPVAAQVAAPAPKAEAAPAAGMAKPAAAKAVQKKEPAKPAAKKSSKKVPTKKQPADVVAAKQD